MATVTTHSTGIKESGPHEETQIINSGTLGNDDQIGTSIAQMGSGRHSFLCLLASACHGRWIDGKEPAFDRETRDILFIHVRVDDRNLW